MGHNSPQRRRCERGWAGTLSVVCMFLLAPTARAENSILIDPDQEDVSATSYYPTFGQIPSKMADNSGLSFPLPTGTAVPTSDSAYPTHDTVLQDMYRSGKDTHPDLFFSLNGGYALSALHYWNFNGDNRSSHPTGGDRETPGDGINTVDIAVSTTTVQGPYTSIGTYTFTQAPATPDYTGVTLPLGATAGAKFVRFHIQTNFNGAGPDASGYFGLSELRFIGSSYAGDANVDGVVDFKDLLPLAQHYGTTAGATRGQGDLNGDGKVDFSDLLLLSQHYGDKFGTPAASAQPAFASALTVAAVPEPAVLGLAALLLAALLVRRRSRFGAVTAQSAVAIGVVLASGTLRAAQIEQQIIDPQKQNVISSSYYPVVDASPQKAVDNSGLSSPVNQGDAVPAVWPTHDTSLTHMYWSGSEVAPVVAFTLPGTYAINSLHYWNYNEPGEGGHGGGSRDGPARGMQNVTIQASTGSVTGPYTTVGTYQFQEAPGDPSYTGITLPLGKTVVARYIKFQVNSDWGGDFSGLSEIRFIGGSQPGDVNLDGAVDFKDLLAVAQHYGTLSGATLDAGDLNHDGKVNFDDLLILSQNYGQSLTATAALPAFAASVVPDPSCAGLLAAIAVTLMVYPRQRAGHPARQGPSHLAI